MSSNQATAIAGNAAAAALDTPQRIVAAWAANDGNAFADAFTEDATMILPGLYLAGREEIRAYMKGAFDGPYKGTRVFGVPLSIRSVTDDVTIITTRGGVLHPGEKEVADERTIRATWVIARQGQDWLITSYQNSPVNG